ncbi:GntR family transcriptional regulator [Fundicoccus culcitae]|uniref:GntR family transcriptional regulator n=1 Tax=Fundicoccus culcitae TaxID=2969821 RepID=A0ABY5P4K1_9LACT|nr:GntR family transcriptional regulator [Fundicoccus culcitae]UUX33535.1 GntR family transcriptional regulator [Fundicoccus culcitae]
MTENFKDKAISLLLEKINNQELDYNTIYSATELSKEFGISRTPMRDAINLLSEQSVVDIVPNKGFRLHKFTESDVLDTYHVRVAVECYQSQILAKNISPILIKKIQESLNKQDIILNTGKNINDFVKEDLNFHFLIVSSNQNKMMISIFEKYSYIVRFLASHAYYYDDRMDSALSEHKKIYEAIKNKDPNKAYLSMLSHLDIPYNLNMSTIKKLFNT